MKAAPIKERPGFGLMKSADPQGFCYMRTPRFLFFDETYKTLSLEAKVVYTFLLARFGLSKLNGWENESGEVFVVCTRKSLADEIGLSYRKAISAMKELSLARLIFECRTGRGDANQIYLAKLAFSEDADEDRSIASSARIPCETVFGASEPADAPEKSRKTKTRTEGEGKQRDALPVSASVSAEEIATQKDKDAAQAPAAESRAAFQEGPPFGSPHICSGRAGQVPKRHFKKCENGTSRDAYPAFQEVRNPHTKKKDLKKIYIKSPSVCPARARESPDDRELDEILERCELRIFDPGTATAFESAVERLYYADSYRVCGVTLPGNRVRSRLRKLTNMCLQSAERKLAENTDRKIRDTTAYITAVVFNSISETHGDLLCDPYLNGLWALPRPAFARRN
jgi:hypothetical protein